jgi:predicted alpha/beta hydrolase
VPDFVAEIPPFEIPLVWYPAPANRAVIVLVPAMGTDASYYGPFAEACAGRGCAVLLAELPGSGASRPRPSRQVDYGYGELVNSYLPVLLTEARRRCSRAPLILVGHSLGAHAASVAVLQGKLAVDALVTIAGGNIHYRNWAGKGAGKVRFVAWLVSTLGKLMGYVPGQHLGLGGPQPRTLMREWADIIRSGSFRHIADPLLSGAAIPVLCIGFEGDFMAPGKSVAGLAHMLCGDMEWLPVSWPGNPHSSWARHPECTLRVIEDWLAGHGLVNAN